eukprot:TRINITY_DN106581_c0_g1_i1.p1 TRINITY_DN106581_c0_g1~~TRINITY_DN106581_c0_g1_i1.p1  ORF type:complete len:510 (-),score=116.98 TRINITY_DN106581_c0_g1_i1:271-1764(-)
MALDGEMLLWGGVTQPAEFPDSRNLERSNKPALPAPSARAGCTQVGMIPGAVAAVAAGWSAARSPKRPRRRHFRNRRQVFRAALAAEDVAKLGQEQEVLQGQLASLEEQLGLEEPKLRKAEAFGLPDREQLQLEVNRLQGLVDECRAKLQALESSLPAPGPESLLQKPPAGCLPPLPSTEAAERQDILKRVDALLLQLVSSEIEGASRKESEEAELKTLELLTSEARPLLRAFGTSERQLPKKTYTLQQLQENGVEASCLLSPKNGTLDIVRNILLAVVALGGAAVIIATKMNTTAFLVLGIGGLTAAFVDQVANRGFLQLLVLDSIGRLISEDYRKRVAQHEAGHFLVAYLLGILPKAYTLSAVDALSKYKSVNVQAGTVFCDSSFQREVQAGKLSGKSLDMFLCTALGGVAAEYLVFGQAEGGQSDIQQLEELFQSLRFDQQQTDLQLRWAVLNTVGLLRRHAATHQILAEAMARGACVGECIAEVEKSLEASSS